MNLRDYERKLLCHNMCSVLEGLKKASVNLSQDGLPLGQILSLRLPVYEA